MLFDARRSDQVNGLQYDVVIIGSGFAGLAIADRLRDSAISVCVLESGGEHPELRTQRLYRASSVGEDYFALDSCRYRLFGGTSNRWGGWCRPLDPIDFEPRDWIPDSGWPIGHHDLAPYFADAAALLELSAPGFGAEHWSSRLSAPGSLSGESFEDIILQLSHQVNFAELYGPRVIAAPNVTTMLHANVTELVMEPGTRRVAGAQVQTLDGAEFAVGAKLVVLAAGGIENARLLLASNRDRGPGIGNEFDLVGRYFMEHLHVPGGHIAGVTGGVPRIYQQLEEPLTGPAERPTTAAAARTRGLLSPRAETLRRQQLPSCSVAVEEAGFSVIGTPFLGWSPVLTTLPVNAYRRLRRIRPGAADRLRGAAERQWRTRTIRQTSQTAQLAMPSGDGQVGGRDRAPLLSTYVRAEQTPNPNSRVTLGARRDALGMPLSQLDWRVNESDWSAVTSWLDILGGTVTQPGSGRRYVPRELDRSEVLGGPHHMGTTRMAASRRKGVVDGDCRVHTTDNLFVAGSSVFTTGGWVNPTFTLVALSLRLADHLREEMRPPARIDTRFRSAVPERQVARART